MDNKYIYTSGLPKFKNYYFIDLEENTWKDYNNFTKKHSLKDFYKIDTLYIIGNDILNESQKILIDHFFTDYLKLGEDLFNLATKNHSIRIKNNHNLTKYYGKSERRKNKKGDFDTESLKLHYLTKYHEEIEDILFLEKDIFEQLSNFKKILDSLVKVNKNIYDTLNDLIFKCELDLQILCIIEDFEDNDIPQKIRFSKLQANLFLFLEDINDVILNTDSNDTKEINTLLSLWIESFLDFKKEFSKLFDESNFEEILLKKFSKNKIKSLTQLKNYHFYNSPIEIFFNYNQRKEIEKTLKIFIKVYGLPYQPLDKEIYKEYKLNENEEIIPCHYLINNSVYHYMIYKLFKDKKNVDNKIAQILNYEKSDKNIKDNRQRIVELKECMDYYNSSINSFYLIENFEYSDNFYIKYENEDDNNGSNVIFSNLCYAANINLFEEIKHLSLTDKHKWCLKCGKEIIALKKNNQYCTDCSKKRKKERDHQYYLRKKEKNIK